MTVNEFFIQIDVLRKMVFKAIEYQKECGEPGKNYEGIFEIHLEYPSWVEDYDADMEPIFCTIVLHCYLIGPYRHYTWKGKTMDEVLNDCRADVEEWCKEVYEDNG